MPGMRIAPALRRHLWPEPDDDEPDITIADDAAKHGEFGTRQARATQPTTKRREQGGEVTLEGRDYVQERGAEPVARL